MRRPLTSRLFPYTTLFRSSDTTIAGRHPNCEIFLDDVTVSRKHAAFVRDGDGFRVRDLGSLYGTYIGKEDRKSTRLNSSHVAISYAVFCLKKKKIIS